MTNQGDIMTGDLLLSIGYCSSMGIKFVTWKSKKQQVVARLSAKADYGAIAHGVCELLQLKNLKTELSSCNLYQ